MSVNIPANKLAGAISRVTKAMGGLTFAADISTMPPPIWRTALLPIPGQRPVTIALSSDRVGCAALATAIAGLPPEDQDLGLIDDLLRELVNMAAGQIKNELSLDAALGLPKVYDGDRLFGNHPDSLVWVHVMLRAGEIQLVVSLAPRVW